LDLLAFTLPYVAETGIDTSLSLNRERLKTDESISAVARPSQVVARLGFSIGIQTIFDSSVHLERRDDSREVLLQKNAELQTPDKSVSASYRFTNGASVLAGNQTADAFDTAASQCRV
jgi:hypothetical protein